MIAVKNACDNDVARIIEIAAASISPAWTYAFVKAALDRDDTLILVASDEGAGADASETAEGPGIIGFAVFRQVGGDGELLQIAVEANRRRSGVGCLLLRSIIGFASEKALASIFLEVRESNSAAIGLYEKHGFERLRKRRNYYNDPNEDAIVMIRGLA